MHVRVLPASKGLQWIGWWFGIYIALCLAIFHKPLFDLLSLSLSSDAYSHLLIIPIVSAGLVYAERTTIFRAALRRRPIVGAVLLLLGGALLALLRLPLLPESSLVLSVLAVVLLTWAGFACFFGAATFWAALFPLGFLLLMLPPPAEWIDRAVTWLQWGSADVTAWIFALTRAPVVRRGLLFDLPEVTIEVAQECSGIRSSIALGITCLAASYLFLKMGWTRAVLMATVIPVVVLKNGIRIATLSLLSMYVDPGFLYGHLHHDGGFVFFGIGMAMMLVLLRLLQKIERRWGGNSSETHMVQVAAQSGQT